MYKDKTKRTEASAERMRRYRDKGVTEQGVTGKGVTLLQRPNGADYNPEELMPDGTLRYMGPFTDGQVLDNKTVGLDLTPSNHVAMKAWANANIFVPNKYAQACHR